jgi:acetolactate synthase I/II/III large subunit
LPASLHKIITRNIHCGKRTHIKTNTHGPQTPNAGKLTPPALCAIVATLQPEGAVVVDESLTSGTSYFEASQGCPPFSHLTLTGGAIGCGPPVAAGAAIACPGRPIISLQADGSAMYSLQALWTQSREGLHVVTVVCANHSYAILKVEISKQRITPRWVGVGGGGIPGLSNFEFAVHHIHKMKEI